MLALMIIFGLFSCFFIVFIYSLMKIGKRADEDEERILSIIQRQSNDYSYLHNDLNKENAYSDIVMQA